MAKPFLEMSKGQADRLWQQGVGQYRASQFPLALQSWQKALKIYCSFSFNSNNTGRGRIRRGEGVEGLARSLISAGVPSVVVSLWSVPDAPTAELMSQFYRNLEQPGMDKAQALRQAMLATMKTNPNPKNWAAFTLIGEAN